MITFEQQRLPTSKKDKEWAKNQVDSIISNTNEFGGDWYRMWQNYRMKNNQVDQREYREYCDTLGLNNDEGKKFIEPFNKSHTIIEVVKGEESKMPWSFGVVNVSPTATNEIIREKEREYRNYVDTRLALEIEKQNKVTEAMVRSKTEGMPPEEADKMIQQITEEFKEKEAKLLDPKKIEAKYINYKTKKEKTLQKLLKALVLSQNIKWVKNQTFEDALLAGIEAIEVCEDEFTKIPYIKQLNPLNLFFHKSPDTPFLHDCHFVGYKEEMTIADILDLYGNDLEDKDVQRLNIFNNKVFGTDAKFHTKDGESPSKWDNMKNYEYTYQHPLSTVPSTGTTTVISDGLYASDRTKQAYYSHGVVYTTYWKSQRSVGKLTYINEEGEEAITIVDEEFPIPDRAIKVNFRPHKFSKLKSRWEWEDSKGLKRSLEWVWVPEIWKGVRINSDIYAKIEPYENAYQSILNPYKTKLPIHGFIYDNRNAFSVCLYDRIKPWQKLYYVVAARWIKLISQDKGVITLLNILMMDKKLGYDRSLQFAVDQGILPYNPMANAHGLGGVVGQMRPAESLDLSNSEQLTYYTKILDFIEQQMKLASGMSDQRLAQTGTSTNVTDNQRDLAQSMNITNSIFSGHEMLWQNVLQSLCESLVKGLDSKSGFVRQVLSDDEIALIDLNLISLEDEYVITIGNNTKAHQTLQEAKSFAQALLQNDKMNFSTLIDLLNTDNLAEFREELRGIEYDIDQREIMMQQQQQQHEQEMLKMQQEQLEAERKQRMDEITLKGEYDILKAQIASMAWDPEKDRDRDGMPDILEIEQFRNDAFNKEEQLNLERQKLAQEDLKLKQTDRQLSNDMLQANADRQSNLVSKQMELAAKEKIEKIKAKNKPKPSKK